MSLNPWADPGCSSSPLQQHGSTELTNLLLGHGADPNTKTDDGKTALAMTHELGHDAVVHILQQHGATG